MRRLAAKDSHQKRPFKSQIYKSRGQNRSYNWEIFRSGQIVGTGDNTQVVGPDKTMETVIFEETLEGMEDQMIEEDIEVIDLMIIIEVGIDQKKGHS